MPIHVPEVIPDTELAARWDVSLRWLQDRFRSGEFPGRKISRRWYVTEDDCAEILRRTAVPAKTAVPQANVLLGSSMTKTTARRLGTTH
jgi:hypothetical protein